MTYPPEMREKIAKEAAGKTVQSLEYCEPARGEIGESYWVMTFTDESEISFKFMAELVR